VTANASSGRDPPPRSTPRRGWRSCSSSGAGPARQAQLEEIDPWWAPAWPITWKRAYSVAGLWWLESDGRVDWAELPMDAVFECEQLGRWVRAQRAGWPELASATFALVREPDMLADRGRAAWPCQRVRQLDPARPSASRQATWRKRSSLRATVSARTLDPGAVWLQTMGRAWAQVRHQRTR
jgi:hypothetical protein